MTIPRMVGVLIALTLVGVVVVAIRADQSATSRRIQKLGFRKSALHQQIWSQEMELADLRSLARIRERAEEFEASGELSKTGDD